MASLRKDRGGSYLVMFRWAGRQYTRSLDTRDQETAAIAVARVDETIMRLKRGWATVPEGVDPGVFITSGGMLTERPGRGIEASGLIRLGDLFDRHSADIPDGVKQASTRTTEKIHCSHLRRVLGESKPILAVTLAEAQAYVSDRSKESFRGRTIQPDTILKELKTLRRIWAWGVKLGLVGAECTWKLRDLSMPKRKAREPFRTFAEIERRLKRGGLSKEDEERLWECLYLTGAELREMLEWAKEHATSEWVYPMITFAATTGARRSELCRSHVDDFDFEHEIVHIRERKRDQSRSETQRPVDMSRFLNTTMRDYFAYHRGGQFTLAQENGERVSVHLARDHFKRTLDGHKKWRNVPGFHTLRHSFASILASRGVDQRIIDSFMGHQTEEMRARYQHLFPAGRRRAIDLLLG